MKYKIVVWGTGGVYNRHVNLLQYYEGKGEMEVVAVTSKDISGIRKIDGYEAVCLSGLESLAYDYILVMGEDSFSAIRQTAMDMGVDAGKILSYKCLEIPHLSFGRYVRLKESNISIISNNCWGGTVYHTLGLECLSPFKNLFLEDDSYLRMLENLEYYLGCKPVPGGFGTDIHNGRKYPVIKLDDVSVHCNHADSHEMAIETWNRRLRKLNWGNLLIEMYTEVKENAWRFASLDRFPRKICFVPFEDNGMGWYHLKLGAGQSGFWEAVLSNAGNGSNSISYRILDLLDGKNSKRWE